jgi:uncharacterized Zn-finger protein
MSIKRRAARTPPHQRMISRLSGAHLYESSASNYTHHPRHQYNNNTSSLSASTSNPKIPVSSDINHSVSNCNIHSNSNNNNYLYGNPQQQRGVIKSYPCPTCEKAFPTRTQLKSHTAIHIDSFPFPCHYTGCDLHFKRKHDLRRHIDAKHALIKKYICANGCGEGFGRRDQMIRHLRKGTCKRSFRIET